MFDCREPCPTATFAVPVVFAVKASAPIAVLLDSVLTFNALLPIAVLSDPVTQLCKASSPIATLLWLVVTTCKAPCPTATFLVPVVSSVAAARPTATLLLPVVSASPAPSPILVLRRASPTSILPLLNVATPEVVEMVTPVPILKLTPS